MALLLAGQVAAQLSGQPTSILTLTGQPLICGPSRSVTVSCEMLDGCAPLDVFLREQVKVSVTTGPTGMEEVAWAVVDPDGQVFCLTKQDCLAGSTATHPDWRACDGATLQSVTWYFSKLGRYYFTPTISLGGVPVANPQPCPLVVDVFQVIIGNIDWAPIFEPQFGPKLRRQVQAILKSGPDPMRPFYQDILGRTHCGDIHIANGPCLEPPVTSAMQIEFKMVKGNGGSIGKGRVNGKLSHTVSLPLGRPTNIELSGADGVLDCDTMPGDSKVIPVFAGAPCTVPDAEGVEPGREVTGTNRYAPRTAPALMEFAVVGPILPRSTIPDVVCWCESPSARHAAFSLATCGPAAAQGELSVLYGEEGSGQCPAERRVLFGMGQPVSGGKTVPFPELENVYLPLAAASGASASLPAEIRWDVVDVTGSRPTLDLLGQRCLQPQNELLPATSPSATTDLRMEIEDIELPVENVPEMKVTDPSDPNNTVTSRSGENPLLILRACAGPCSSGPASVELELPSVLRCFPSPQYRWELRLGGTPLASQTISAATTSIPLCAYLPAGHGEVFDFVVGSDLDCNGDLKGCNEVTLRTQVAVLRLTGMRFVGPARRSPSGSGPDCIVALVNTGEVSFRVLYEPAFDPALLPPGIFSWTNAIPDDSTGITATAGTLPARQESVTVRCAGGGDSASLHFIVLDAEPPPSANPAVTPDAPVHRGLPLGTAVIGDAFGRTRFETLSIDLDVFFDMDVVSWMFRVKGVTPGYFQYVLRGRGPNGEIDIVSPTQITRANCCEIMRDFEPPPPDAGHGPLRLAYYSSAITQAHEDAHVDRFFGDPTLFPIVVTLWEGTVESDAFAFPLDCDDPLTLSKAAVEAAVEDVALTHLRFQEELRSRRDSPAQPPEDISGNPSERFAHNVSNPMYSSWVALAEAASELEPPRDPTDLSVAPATVPSVPGLVLRWVDRACNEDFYMIAIDTGSALILGQTRSFEGFDTAVEVEYSMPLQSGQEIEVTIYAQNTSGDSAPLSVSITIP